MASEGMIHSPFAIGSFPNTSFVFLPTKKMRIYILKLTLYIKYIVFSVSVVILPIERLIASNHGS